MTTKERDGDSFRKAAVLPTELHPSKRMVGLEPTAGCLKITIIYRLSNSGAEGGTRTRTLYEPNVLNVGRLPNSITSACVQSKRPSIDESMSSSSISQPEQSSRELSATVLRSRSSLFGVNCWVSTHSGVPASRLADFLPIITRSPKLRILWGLPVKHPRGPASAASFIWSGRRDSNSPVLAWKAWRTPTDHPHNRITTETNLSPSFYHSSLHVSLCLGNWVPTFFQL